MGKGKKSTYRFAELGRDKFFSYKGKAYRKDWCDSVNGILSVGIELVTGKAFYVESEANVGVIDKRHIDSALATIADQNAEKGRVARRQSMLTYGEHTIRSVTEGGKRDFVLKDICRVVGIRNHRHTFRKWKKNAKGVALNYSLCEFSSHGGMQRVIIVAKEEALAILGRSRKPNAHAFYVWLRENT